MVNENNSSQREGTEIRKERFEFILTINDFIVCQRYFKINGLRPEAFYSCELLDTMKQCTALIKRDLKNKTAVYNKYTAPKVFNNREEFDNYVAKHSYELDVCDYVVFRESEEVFVWNGNDLELYDKRFNLMDYITPKNVEDIQANDIKFTFLDEGKIVYSEMWDGNVYPRFVRNNIDLSNSKNRYGDDKPYEAFLMKMMIKDESDLVPIIINKICDVCSSKNKHYNSELGNTMPNSDKCYHTNVRNIPMKQFKKYIKTVVNE